MQSKFFITLIATLLFMSLSCAGNDSGQTERETESISAEGTPTTAETGEDLPFVLTINGDPIDSDRRASVTERRNSEIRFSSSDVQSCRLDLIHPDGESITIGEWQSREMEFMCEFPYGENHLVLAYGDTVYDILVVSGAPEPEIVTGGCDDAFIDLHPNSRWELKQTSKNEAPSRWSHQITGWTINESDDAFFKLLMERSSGIENRIDHSTELDMRCSDGVIYIISALEKEVGIERLITYEPDSIYIPETIAEGVSWDRRANYVIRTPDTTVTGTLFESQRCTGLERISVEAGEFDAYRVEFIINETLNDSEFSTEGTSWYVPGLGRVLSTGNTEEAPRLELVSYEGISPGL